MTDALDTLDQDLIALLRADSRTPAALLAKQLKVSRGTVQNRITRLQRSGVLLGFTVKLASEGLRGVRAITQIEVRGGATDKVVAALRRLPEVVSVYSTNGRWDLVVEVRTEDLLGFDQALRRLRDIEGIAASETSLLLAEQR
ncbi:Lrp/AsnC family transcriptional regulator [Pseudoxanthomonas sp. JBR18]|uniref:Lrp/AsnC family transcriptional regulator n=1 Tax=Pseudoxanthomonas sp. JBR18 TaxID=2969308 RepID=UPI002306B031|nr:Lrp/AsnC family transcriptional regulator [Pseudoxanthomonas sp. JBR18]WCE05762.1 Lrp/AsnC family transcriptional regulator [Pseudoxanthomonas sp. JBR18]